MKKQNKEGNLKNSKKETEDLENLDKELKDLISTNETLNVSIKKFIDNISKEKTNHKSKKNINKN